MPLARLTDRAVLPVSGPDARALLQRVLTLDMDRVAEEGAGYGALLTPQGKALVDFLVHAEGQGYAFDLRADAAEPLARRLTLYRLRAQVEIGPVDPGLAVFTAWGGSRPEGARADPRWAALGERFVAPADAFAPDAALVDYHAHRIALAVPEGGVDWVFGETFPHDAGMDSLAGIAFDKGCFVGQEVVSRMRHRGTARRRIVALAGEAELPEPGAEIAADGRPLGRLGSSWGGRGVALVRLDRTRAALDAGHIVAAGGVPVEVTLPAWAAYGWPVATDAASAED